MPEVTEREIVKQAKAAGTEFTTEIEKNFRMLEALMGSRSTYSIPSADDIEEGARARLRELEPYFLRVPFTLEHANSALDRVNSGLPPNNPKNQQYKDSAIWEAVLVLARTYRVYFITNDNGFYKSPEKPPRGLADSLAEECKNIGGVVRLYRDISSCLEDLQADVAPLDHDEVVPAIERVILPSFLEAAAAARNFKLTGGRIGSSLSPFAMEKPDELAITFDLSYRLSDDAGDDDIKRLDASLTARGSCFYHQASKEVSSITMSAEIFSWTDQSGERHTNTNHYVTASTELVVGGRRTVPYTVREPVQ